MKPPPHNTLHNQMIGTASSSNSHPKIKFPIGRHIQINRRKNLLLLVMHWIKVSNRPQRSVILNPTRNLLGEVIADLGIRRETPPVVFTSPMKRLIHSGIKREIPPPDFFIDNRTNFPSPRIRRKVPLLITELRGKAQPNWPMPGIRNRHPRPNMIAHPHPPAIGLNRREDIEPSLKPAGKPVRDLQSLVLGVIGGKHTIDHGLGSLHGEVAMDLYHRVARRNQVRPVNLDLCVILGAPRSGRAEDCKQGGCDAKWSIHPIPLDNILATSSPEVLDSCSRGRPRPRGLVFEQGPQLAKRRKIT